MVNENMFENIEFININSILSVYISEKMIYHDKISLRKLLNFPKEIIDSPEISKERHAKTAADIALVTISIIAAVAIFASDGGHSNNNSFTSNSDDDMDRSKNTLLRINNKEFLKRLRDIGLEHLNNNFAKYSKTGLFKHSKAYFIYKNINKPIILDEQQCQLISEFDIDNKKYIITQDAYNEKLSINEPSFYKIFEISNKCLKIFFFGRDRLYKTLFPYKDEYEPTIEKYKKFEMEYRKILLGNLKNFTSEFCYYYNLASNEIGSLAPERTTSLKYENKLVMHNNNVYSYYYPPIANEPQYIIETRTFIFSSKEERNDFISEMSSELIISMIMSKKNKLRAYRNDLVLKIEKVLAENKYKSIVILLDSNIWLGQPVFLYDLKDTIAKYNRKITLIKEIYDELCNIKDREDFGTARSKKARTALNIIENLQTSNLITFDSIGYQAAKNTYADPKFVKWIETKIKKNIIIAINNDTELRIRIRSIINDNNLILFGSRDTFDN
jgi:hypothetical protein